MIISPKLKTIFSLSIPLFIVHGLEEYFQDFFMIDSHVDFVFGYLYTLPIQQATFLLFQFALWLILIFTAILIANDTWRLRLMIIPGLIYIYEFHHFRKALIAWDYYPGVITAILFPLIGFLYRKELLKIYSQSK